MGSEFVVQITNEAVKVALMLAAPMLGGALVVGILVSLFQAVTQINEQTLSFIPKILVIVIAMVLGSSWMIDTLTTFTNELYTSIPSVIRAP
jgi:flagellar biosynthetic protein FliQ